MTATAANFDCVPSPPVSTNELAGPAAPPAQPASLTLSPQGLAWWVR